MHNLTSYYIDNSVPHRVHLFPILQGHQLNTNWSSFHSLDCCCNDAAVISTMPDIISLFCILVCIMLFWKQPAVATYMNFTVGDSGFHVMDYLRCLNATLSSLGYLDVLKSVPNVTEVHTHSCTHILTI